MYYYNYNDNDTAITTGANATITYAGVIQAADKFGGYNTKFTISGSTSEYHIHFANGGTKVKDIRFKGNSNAEGDNIIKHGAGDTLTLAKLAYECTGFKNHVELLKKFKEAIENAPRHANGNLK
jgi:hypothetical protein